MKISFERLHPKSIHQCPFNNTTSTLQQHRRRQRTTSLCPVVLISDHCTMTLISLAIVGKRNEPLFLKEFRDDVTSMDIPEAELFGLAVQSGMGTDGFSARAKECSLKQQFILHAALDRFDELLGVGGDHSWRDPNATGADAMWVGLLCPVEDMRVYGYVTTTKIKLMAVVEDIITSRPIQTKVMEEELKQLLISIHKLLVEYIMNPFNKIDDNKINSPRFNKGVLDSVSQFNRTV